MSGLLLVALLALNGLISWYNAKICGEHWEETKLFGGFPRVLMWCGAIQSVIGFSMIILFAEAYIAISTGHLPPKAAEAVFSLWYLLVIVPAIGTGLVITVHSWIVAWRERNIANIGTAAWNTFASASNIYQAANGGVSEAFGKVGDLFSSDDSKEAAAIKLVIAMVVISLLGGVLVTMYLIRKYARNARQVAAFLAKTPKA